MDYFFFQFNRFRSNPWRVFWTACAVLIVVGIIFTEISVCRITEFLYDGYRLAGAGHPSLMCRIF